MCNLITEGTSHGCGHYVITKRVDKVDCGSPRCKHSNRHDPNCRDCFGTCSQYLGPDRSETVTQRVKDFCDSCHQYYFIRKPQILAEQRAKAAQR
ncbi:hypothetical protein SISSUDRAFT_1126454 [Sistotremastrum suecicum HHB10207 ss-3]|uniref:Uncharacterized protein n=1 Tax=Sistotremastrum suecicum HHB10207 ss-3 TaxID=1314776 RepID=A0A166GAT8_9AGAM|nr:hypothetical protein SISSUDRAFT_1126454 [Sistotremastrum suecicum HHB10207 ss-3]